MSNPRLILTAPRLQDVEQLPPDTPIDPTFNPSVTIGWLLDQLHQGRLPEAPATTPQMRADIARNLMVSSVPYDSVPLVGCQAVSASQNATLERGDQLVVANASARWQLRWDMTWSSSAELHAAPYVPAVLVALSGPLHVHLEVADATRLFDLCVRRSGSVAGAGRATAFDH